MVDVNLDHFSVECHVFGKMKIYEIGTLATLGKGIICCFIYVEITTTIRACPDTFDASVQD